MTGVDGTRDAPSGARRRDAAAATRAAAPRARRPDAAEAAGPTAASAGLEQALAAIAAGAAELDRAPRFPREAFERLADAGALASTIGAVDDGASVRPGWDLLRRVAAADASVGRILDGHLNAVERLEVVAAPEVRERELAAVAAGERLLGVWGADPGPGEGEPARLVEAGAGLVLRGAKTFCSGAGGVDAALVMVDSDDGTPPALVLLDCGAAVEVDRSWYRAAGLRASESHRVFFRDAPVTAVLGGPGELGRDPWFSRDAMRTAASWAGMVDAAVAAALDELAGRRPGEPLAQLAAGRIVALQGTVDAWLAGAAPIADAAAGPLPSVTHGVTKGRGVDPRATSVALRAEIDRAARAVLETAAAACGSHPFVTGGRLDRARRDLEVFLLQHRLDPLLTRLGAAELGRR
ncbi:MAG TPA: acyl-CoA dehydrogenase family protein [Solirubrobacterales bacterium]|nr:acyl-CoA dehydrogenase family protein [Solirubrobacterales bacterium]